MTKYFVTVVLSLAALVMIFAAPPVFESVQPATFAAPGAFSNAWADFDNDGDLDLFVGFAQGIPNRLYRNDRGTFTDVAAELGVADVHETRGAAWGDFDADGYLDLYVGFIQGTTFDANTAQPNRLYRNVQGKRFVDVAQSLGVDVKGVIRQVSWADFDADGDLDLFVSLRERANLLFRNDAGRFVEVAKTLGVADPRRSLGAAWFDFDKDADLDLFVANNNGDLNGLYRNDRTTFVDVAKEMGVAEPPARPGGNRGVGVCLGDFNTDGDLDLYVTNEDGPSMLFRRTAAGFVDEAPKLGLAADRHHVACTLADYDNDGRTDLYVTGFLSSDARYRDFFYRNESEGSTLRFVDVTPPNLIEADSDHGVQFADFDQDGDLDVSFTHSAAKGGHHMLFRNMLPADQARRAIQILVLDKAGRYTRAGSEVRVYAAGTRRILGTGIVDSGSGYNTQNAMPVHVGLPNADAVDIEVTSLTGYQRTITRSQNVNPAVRVGRPLTIRVP